jgi:hypothetical protein
MAEPLVTLSKQLAIEVQALVEHFRANGLFGAMSRRSSATFTDTPIYFSNDSDETIPPYACMQVTGTVEQGGQNYLQVDKPADTDATAGGYVFNGPSEVLSGGDGIAQKGPVFRAFKDTGTVTAGDKWGPTVGEWYLTLGNGAYIVCGEDDILDDVFKVLAPVSAGGGDAGRFVLSTTPTGGATGALGDYMTATADIYQTDAGGVVSILEEDVTLLLDYEMFADLVSGDYGPAVKDARGRWLAVNAPCQVSGGSG